MYVVNVKIHPNPQKGMLLWDNNVHLPVFACTRKTHASMVNVII